MIIALWAALMGLLMILWENLLLTIAGMFMISAAVSGYRLWRMIRKRKRAEAAADSKVTMVAFGEADLTDLDKADLVCDYYVRVGDVTSRIYSSVERVQGVTLPYINDGHGETWGWTDADVVVPREGRIVAILAAHRFESEQALSSILFDLGSSSGWQHLSETTQEEMNRMNPQVAYALAQINDISLEDRNRPAAADVADQEIMDNYYQRRRRANVARERQQATPTPDDPPAPTGGGRLITLD